MNADIDDDGFETLNCKTCDKTFRAKIDVGFNLPYCTSCLHAFQDEEREDQYQDWEKGL